MKPLYRLTPARIVEELDKYIIGQSAAKRMVAIALRNRWRRQHVPAGLQSEITPNNIILIGPTGVGKTEIARRLSRLAQAPFIKVEASKYTEVGYVGRDVESMIRELMDLAVNETRAEMTEKARKGAAKVARERLLDLLLPPPRNVVGDTGEETRREEQERYQRSRARMSQMLGKGQLDDREVEVRQDPQSTPPQIEVFSNLGAETFEFNIGEMLSTLTPFKRDQQPRRLKVPQALEFLSQQEAGRMVSKEDVVEEARRRVENNGIIFIDEIDKIASTDREGRADVSRSGVQRDLLPIVEGSNVPTKHGMVDTTHVLFIAAGAFHSAKPSDLIPELQGRFPIRVELNSLTESDFVQILTTPRNALTRQYIALFKTEGADLSFSAESVSEIARYAALANRKMEDIGARRLHTVMNTLLEEYLFSMPDAFRGEVRITVEKVRERLDPIITDEDLSRYIL
jgi:ATP-dependent HslUV protease ATP-binding subunit HslU